MKKDKLKITVIDHENGFIGPSCMRGFQANGHEVQLLKLKGEEGTKVLDLFDITLLLTEIIPFGPDLIVDINGKACDSDGISLTAFRILNIPVFIWFVDNPLIALNYGSYNFSDMFTKLVYDRSQCEEMRNLGIRNTYHLPLGVDNDYFKPLKLTPEEEKRYKADISFVGHSYADRCTILRNVLRNRWPDMPAVINDVIKYSVDTLINGENRTGKSTPKVLKEALEYFGINPVYPHGDIEWIMNIIIEHESGRDYRGKLVSPLIKYGIKIYGNKSWIMLLGSYNKICPPVHYFEELPKVYNASSINLNISRTQLVTAVNQRVFDVPACRSFLLTDFKEELEEYFKIGEEIICYQNKDDLSRLVGFYLRNPLHRKKISEAGFNRVMTEHTYSVRMEKLLDIYKDMPETDAVFEGYGDAWEKANLFVGQAYLNLSHKEKSFLHFKRALNKGSASFIDNLNSVGVSLLQQKEYKDCIPVFHEAASLDPAEPSFLSNLGLAYQNSGQYEEAECYYKKALEIDSSFVPASSNLKYLYTKINQSEKKNSISLCMIVKDEEDVLASCLESVSGIADEIIIVDTGSKDNTCKIASAYGAKIIHTEWTDDFSVARNISIQNATSSYILWLDADEIISPVSRDLILKLKHNLPESKDISYSVIITSKKDKYDNKNNQEEESFRRLRIFPNLSLIEFKGKVHEDVADSLNQAGIKVIPLDINLEHSGYRNDDEIRMKVRRNILLLIKQLELMPDDALVMFYLANSFYCIGDVGQAIYYMDKVRGRKELAAKNIEWYPYSYVKLAQFYRESDKQDDSLKVYKELLSLFPEFGPGYFFYGEALFFQRRYAESLKVFEMLAEFKIEVGSYPLPVKKMEYLKYYYSGCCLMEAGDNITAAEKLFKAMEIDPDSLTLHVSLSRLFALAGDLQSCVEACNRVLRYTDMNIDREINSIKDLSSIFDSIGETLEARSLLHEAMEAYKTALVLLADKY